MTDIFMDCDLIIKGKYVLPIDEKLSVIKDGMVIIDKGKIIDLGEKRILAKKYNGKEIIDAKDSIVMPGLINTHTHAAMSYFRGLADDLPLKIWLEEYIWPAEAKFLNPGFIKQSAELACLEMLKSGITCFNDMYFFEEITASVAEQFGLRAVLGEAILNFPTPSCATPAETINKTLELYQKFKNSQLIKVILAPHSIYTCAGEILKKVKFLADRYNLLIHSHISETKKEVEDSQKKYLKSPIEYLDSLNFLSDKVIAAHSVWLSGNDLKIYQDRGVKVSHCPMSNMKLASGVALLPQMIKRGITVGLGTDSAASNNTLDLFTDMRACALLHKVSNLDPTLVNARQVVKMVTINGAKVLNWDKEIGSLEVGKQADIITINLDQPHLLPLHDPYSHLVYCVNSADVENVIINGRIIMKQREVKNIDEAKIIEQAKRFKI